MNWYEVYGIEPLNLDEEMNLSEFSKQTRKNKIRGIDKVRHMKEMLETMEMNLRAAPEKDSKVHAEIVQRYTDKIDKAYDYIWKICMSSKR